MTKYIIVDGVRREMTSEEEAAYDAQAAAIQANREAEYIAEAPGRIDNGAEGLRGLWLTPGSGQAMSYLKKEEAARSVLAVIQGGGTPDPEDYPNLAPLLGVEVDPEGNTVNDLQTLATIILAEAAAAAQFEGQIDAVRRSAKIALASAATYAETVSIVEAAESQYLTIRDAILDAIS